MGTGVGKAIEQMRQHDEAGLNYIFSKTYNFVYLRAKNILDQEEDVKNLVQKVYLQMYEMSDALERENLYEWLGKQVYILGSRWYRKRKEREADFIEMEEDELTVEKNRQLEESADFISKTVDQLPYLYQATMYAFYYDYLRVEEIAELMQCEAGIVRNRLNYTRKYLLEAMEESSKDVSFTIETVRAGLRKWSIENCLGMTATQNVYTSICRELGLQAESIYVEGKEFAGVNNTIVYHQQDGLECLKEEILAHSPKAKVNKKQVVCIAAIVIAVTIVIILGVVLAKDAKDHKKTNDSTQITQEDKTEDEQKIVIDETEESAGDGALVQPEDSEYVFPNSDKELLKKEQLQQYTKEQLRLGRNEIYARHGMVFGGELGQYFQSKTWYRLNPAVLRVQDCKTNMIEDQNVEIIKQVEATK